MSDMKSQMSILKSYPIETMPILEIVMSHFAHNMSEIQNTVSKLNLHVTIVKGNCKSVEQKTKFYLCDMVAQ